MNTLENVKQWFIDRDLRTPNTTVIMDVISFIEKYKTKIIGNIYENKELLDA
jgi:hypothetical protein